MSKKREYENAQHARLEWAKRYKDSGKSGGDVFVVFDEGDEVRVGQVVRNDEGKYAPTAINGSKTELPPNSNLQQAVRSILAFKGCSKKVELVRVKVEAKA